MSYFAFIPVDAQPWEHMTFIYCGKLFDDDEIKTEMLQREAEMLSTHCPFEGVVFKHSIFNGVIVAEVAVPYEIHLLRSHWGMYEDPNTSYKYWRPHISLYGGNSIRPLLSTVIFKQAEYCE